MKEKQVKELHESIFDFLEYTSNKTDITGYEWREACAIMLQMEELNLIESNPNQELTRGEVIVARFGWNDVLSEPFEFLYEFGYYTKNGCVVYKQGETNMQDASAFKLRQIRKAESEDMNNFNWG